MTCLVDTFSYMAWTGLAISALAWLAAVFMGGYTKEWLMSAVSLLLASTAYNLARWSFPNIFSSDLRLMVMWIIVFALIFSGLAKFSLLLAYVVGTVLLLGPVLFFNGELIATWLHDHVGWNLSPEGSWVVFLLLCAVVLVLVVKSRVVALMAWACRLLIACVGLTIYVRVAYYEGLLGSYTAPGLTEDEPDPHRLCCGTVEDFAQKVGANGTTTVVAVTLDQTARCPVALNDWMVWAVFGVLLLVLMALTRRFHTHGFCGCRPPGYQRVGSRRSPRVESPSSD